MFFAGTPTAKAPGGTLFTTKLFAAIRAPFPIVTLPRMAAPVPIKTSSPITGTFLLPRMLVPTNTHIMHDTNSTAELDARVNVDRSRVDQVKSFTWKIHRPEYRDAGDTF